MLRWGIAPTFDGTLLRHTASALEKELFTFSPTQPTDGTAILCHFFYLRLPDTGHCLYPGFDQLDLCLSLLTPADASAVDIVTSGLAATALYAEQSDTGTAFG